jgi:hypothetical protein
MVSTQILLQISRPILMTISRQILLMIPRFLHSGLFKSCEQIAFMNDDDDDGDELQRFLHFFSDLRVFLFNCAQQQTCSWNRDSWVILLLKKSVSTKFHFEDSKFVSSAKGHAQWEWELENHHRIELCLGASICISNFSFAYNWGADRMNEWFNNCSGPRKAQQQIVSSWLLGAAGFHQTFRYFFAVFVAAV